MKIRTAKLSDAETIAEIYNFYVENSHHTFETESVSIKEMENRIRSISAMYPFLVAEMNKEIIGYAYAARYKLRPAYKFSVESSIYIAQKNAKKGIGNELYAQLVNEIFKAEYHTVIAGIALPNEASIKLHEKLGFVKTAHFREVGYKFGRWIDVGYWQLFKTVSS